MFINARPRPDPNSFRSFVPSRIVELSYHWPNSMTNHGTNAWNNLRPAASSAAAPGAWAYRSDAASNEESYSEPLTQNLFLEHSEAISSYGQARLGNKSIPAAPKRVEHPQPHSTQLGIQFPCDLQELQSPCLESPIPLPGANTNSHEWIIGRSTANSSRFPGAQYSSNACSYTDQPSFEVDDTTSMLSSTGGSSMFSPYDTSAASESFGSNNIETGSTYQCPFEPGVVPSSSMAVAFTAQAAHGSFDNGKLWHEMARNSNSVDPCSMAFPFTYDALPNTPSAFWSMQSGPLPTWSQQTVSPGTISPQALSLVTPSSSPIPRNSSPRSSSGLLSETSAASQVFQELTGDIPYPPVQSVTSTRIQSQGPDDNMPYAKVQPIRSKAFQTQISSDCMPDSKLGPAASQGFRISQSSTGNTHPTTEFVPVQEFQIHRSASNRQHLMTLSIISQANNADIYTGDPSRRAVGTVRSERLQTQKSILATSNSTGRVLRPRRKLPSGRKSESNGPPLSSNIGFLSRSHKELVMARSRIPSSRPDDAKSSLSAARQYPRKASSLHRPLGSGKSETKIKEKPHSSTTIETERAATLSGTEDTLQHRIAKDKFLLDSKRDGKSYKQIRLEGGFTEAESTLRGRHRALTKKPEDRVRKPEWESNDLHLLKKAVHKLAGDPNLPRPKKVSWKEVSDYIVDHGGSYRFGNSTCRKKWSELYAKSSDQDLS